MQLEHFFYIFENPYVFRGRNHSAEIPIIVKVRNNYPILPQYDYSDAHAEGPFESITELKKKSIIFSRIKLQKHKQRVLASKNIQTMTDHILTRSSHIFDTEILNGFHHITVGKISKNIVRGIHFFNPERVRIEKIIEENTKTKVYSAEISKYDENKNEWKSKHEISTFFPDDWTLSLLYNEIDFAFNNKIRFSENSYVGETSEGIKVKFIIKDEKILTIYPEI